MKAEKKLVSSLEKNTDKKKAEEKISEILKNHLKKIESIHLLHEHMSGEGIVLIKHATNTGQVDVGFVPATKMTDSMLSTIQNNISAYDRNKYFVASICIDENYKTLIKIARSMRVMTIPTSSRRLSLLKF